MLIDVFLDELERGGPVHGQEVVNMSLTSRQAHGPPVPRLFTFWLSISPSEMEGESRLEKVPPALIRILVTCPLSFSGRKLVKNKYFWQL